MCYSIYSPSPQYYWCCFDFQERSLALRSEGLKMTLASERPHLLALDNDVYGGRVVIYHLMVHIFPEKSMCLCLYYITVAVT